MVPHWTQKVNSCRSLAEHRPIRGARLRAAHPSFSAQSRLGVSHGIPVSYSISVIGETTIILQTSITAFVMLCVLLDISPQGFDALSNCTQHRLPTYLPTFQIFLAALENFLGLFAAPCLA